jgi:hypothetical protein
MAQITRGFPFSVGSKMPCCGFMHLDVSVLEASAMFKKLSRHSQKSMLVPATLPIVEAQELEGRRLVVNRILTILRVLRKSIR